jgi:signal transduction histidine kinase
MVFGLEANSANSDLRVLVLAPFGKDATLIKAVLDDSKIASHRVLGVSELTSAISEGAGGAVVTEEILQDQAVDLLRSHLSEQPPWSDFPMIVLTSGGISTAATEREVRSLASLGNVSLLERPLRPATLISSVRTALGARQRQYEIRDHLDERQQAEEALRRTRDELESLVAQRTTALRRLSSRLLRVQDEERRRIARELHDGLGQYLTAAKINLDVLARSDGDGGLYLREAQQLIDRAISDTRTLSHLLHPPLLDEAGFASAARWYVESFGKRCGIAVVLGIPDLHERLSSETETALFRILQEALTNVHRHSGSRSVEIHLTRNASSVVLSVQDHGKGVPPETLARFQKDGTNVGVGLAGMRERVKELGGSLVIESSSQGTLLRATLPIALAEKTRLPQSTAPSRSKSTVGAQVL